MTPDEQAKALAGIGMDLVKEGGGMALIESALAMAKGQVPQDHAMGVAAMMLMEAGSAAAVGALCLQPHADAKEALDALIDGFRDVTMQRLAAMQAARGIK